MPEDDVTKQIPPDMVNREPQPPEKQRGRIGTVIGDYTVEGELGRGGMGVVYRARQGELNRLVALKMLTGHYGDDELQRFLAEAQTAAALNHTNIVHIYEVGEFDGAPFFSMEYVEGGTLGEQLRKGLPTPRKAAELLMTIARALHFAHQHGVIHRDMKPGNVLIDPDGVPKIADFGIAKRLGNDSQLTLSGAIIGTPTYMAPEQAGGTSRNVGPAADVYSLGAMLYEMLTGRPPFLPDESETPMTVRVLTEDTTSPAWHRPEIPREIEIICMKCLQKDPRDRYSSAAAFAEDLRRFIDDEGILARPPSRIMKAIKWSRRHPWKFTGSIALVLLVVFGGRALWQWEFYQRLRTEYAEEIEYVRGGFEPTRRESKQEAGRHAVNLRLTRRGRLGPVVFVEVLNARGHPAVLRTARLPEAIPLYIEGITGAQPYWERLPETTTVELFYDGDTVRELKGRDRTGTVNWRLIYDQAADTGPASEARGSFSRGDEEPKSAGGASTAKSVHARFANVRGSDKSSVESSSGSEKAAHLEFQRDAAGRDTLVRFFDAADRPAPNGEKVYGYRIERDATGHILRLFNLGRDGSPAPNRDGLSALAYRRGKDGRLARCDMLDAEAKPLAQGGPSSMTWDYDAAGNAIRLNWLDVQGKPLVTADGNWSVQELARNKRGELVGRTYWQLGADGTRRQLSETVIAYDDFGHPADISFSGEKKWRTAFRNDADGSVLEETFLGADGQPVPGERGFASRRQIYTRIAQGLRREETYFDAKGGKTYNQGGYHRLIDVFDPSGSLGRQTQEEHDPARFRYFRFVVEMEHDAQGRLRRSVSRFEDESGKLAVNAGLSFTTSETTFDDNARETVVWEIGWPVANVGAPVWRRETEWYHTGIMRRRVWQAFDDRRVQLDTVSNNDPSRTEEDFDAVGKLTRRLETGYAESRLGFHSRELRLASGNFESAVLRRSDGSEVKDVRVLVHSILPDAQPTTAQLRPGDQFLTANGERVVSALEWMIGTNFSGGWIEVMRDGKRLRLEGFLPGKLGILLEDRGPGVP